MYISTAVAGLYQSHDSIYKVAERFIHKQVKSQNEQQPDVKASGLDSRLKLEKCDKSLEAFLTKGSRELGRTTVGVKCNGSKPWSLHVPVTISIYKNVLVASRTLKKGDVLTKADLRLAKHDLGSLSHGFFESKKSGIGMMVKRRTQPGTVLTPSMIKKPQVIKRGQKVAILAQSGRMQVRMMGKALNNGAVGDRIGVMNIKTHQKLEGIVISIAEVRVDI